MNVGDIILILLLPAAVVVAAACAASETAVFSLSRSDRVGIRRARPAADAAVGRLLARPRSFLLLVLLITNLANVVYFVVGSVLERRIRLPGVGIAVNILLLGILIIFADLLPKLLARANRDRFCRAAAPLLLWFLRALGPVIEILETIVVAPLLRLIRPSGALTAPPLTAEELAALLDLSAAAGEIAVDDQRLFADVVELGRTRVRDVMTPRIAMSWVEESAAPAKVKEAIAAAKTLWLPVFRRSLDGPAIGLLDVRRYLPAAEGMTQPGAAKVSQFIRPVLFVPERARLDQLLELLRERGGDRALCVDEFGAVVGLVRIHDVVAELVSVPVTAAAERAEGVMRIGSDRWIVPGRLSVRELMDHFAPQRDPRAAVSSGVSTVAGLMFARLGRVPQVGDSTRLGNVELRVEQMTGRAIDRVSVSVEAEPAKGAA